MSVVATPSPTDGIDPDDVTPEHRAIPALVVVWLVCLGVLFVVCFFSVTLGSRGISPADFVKALLGTGDAGDEVVVQSMRAPRTLIGLLAGAALAIGGAILQGVTRNPLGDPGIMGINASAAMFVVGGIMVFGAQQPVVYIWLAFAGAGAATVLVYVVASFGREGATPIKLALAGAAVTAIASSLTNAVVVTHVDALNELRFWQVGGLAGQYFGEVKQTAPFLVAGIVLGVFAGRALNGLALGDDLAKALGQNVQLTRGVLFALVAVLCGAATAAVGPIVFIGLIVPHVARAICGPDYRWVLAFCLLLGPIILLSADILGRLVLTSGELQVGIVLGVLGAPAFIALIRFRNLVQL